MSAQLFLRKGAGGVRSRGRERESGRLTCARKCTLGSEGGREGGRREGERTNTPFLPSFLLLGKKRCSHEAEKAPIPSSPQITHSLSLCLFIPFLPICAPPGRSAAAAVAAELIRQSSPVQIRERRTAAAAADGLDGWTDRCLAKKSRGMSE